MFPDDEGAGLGQEWREGAGKQAEHAAPGGGPLALGIAVLGGAATAEASITTNTIAPTATLPARGYIARAHVLIACTEGQFVLFTLTLAQGSTTATGHGPGAAPAGGVTAVSG